MERGKALPNSDLNHIGVLLLNVTEYNQYNKTNKVEKYIKNNFNCQSKYSD